VEIPAGTADPIIDRSITGVTVRELWEETHLRALRLNHAVGLGLTPGTLNLTSSGEVQDARMDSEYPLCLLHVSGLHWAVVAFLTKVEDEPSEILLQEDEHVEWAWLTEGEVEKGFFRDRPEKNLDMVSHAMKSMLLEGFRLMKEKSHA
jgi:8-oxo-dGTP pyrophosphatase MutT (NUDIX family)